MQRRRFLTTLATAAAMAPLPALAGSGSWQDSFRVAREREPWLLAFRSVTAPALEGHAQLEGRLPDDLSGTLYRNGPARHEIGDFRYHHWFDGDGMIQAFRFRAGTVQHQAKMVATRKYLAETDAGRALYPGFASAPPNPKPVTSPDQVNAANISVLPHHGKLYALWEAGSAWEIDSETLDTEGIHHFSPETAGLPFSAHPRVAPDGTLWNFGYVSNAGKLVFWHIDASGTLQNVAAIPCEPMGMPHDFVVTERHLLIMIPPLHFEPAGAGTFMDAHRWHPERPTRVLVVDKNDFSQYRFFELPAQWVFHYGNAWEDSSGVIHFDAARADSPMAMIESFRSIMKGEIVDAAGATHYEYRIDLKRGTAAEAPLLASNINSEFPTIDPRVSTQRYSRLVMLTADSHNPAPHSMLNAVSSMNLHKERLDTFRYPDSIIPEEHLYVPKPGSAPEQDGWVIGTALNYAAERTELRVFEANHLSDGPVAVASLPYALPLGLHGKFA